MKTVVSLTCVSLILVFASSTFAWLDDFGDGKDDGWTVIQGDWEVKNGQYRQKDTAWTTTETNETYHRSYFGDVKWSDYTVEVDVTIDDPGDLAAIAGIFIRVSEKSDEGQYYFFRIDLRPDCGPGAIQSPNHTFDAANVQVEAADPEFNDLEEAGVTYHLKVIAEGNHFLYYIDDELMLDVVDEFDPVLSGAVGLATFNAGALFDNFQVTGEGIPGCVSREGKLTACWGMLKAETK